MNLKFSKYSVISVAGTLVFVIVVEMSFAYETLHPEEPPQKPLSPKQSRTFAATQASSASYSLISSDIMVSLNKLKEGYYGRF